MWHRKVYLNNNNKSLSIAAAIKIRINVCVGQAHAAISNKLRKIAHILIHIIPIYTSK